MAERRVTATAKDRDDGHITALCNLSSTWKRVSRSQAVKDIKSGDPKYYVQEVGTARVYVHVYGGKFLRTNADPSSKNNLKNLPDC